MKGNTPKTTSRSDVGAHPPPPPASHEKPRSLEVSGMSRDVLDLLTDTRKQKSGNNNSSSSGGGSTVANKGGRRRIGHHDGIGSSSIYDSAALPPIVPSVTLPRATKRAGRGKTEETAGSRGGSKEGGNSKAAEGSGDGSNNVSSDRMSSVTTSDVTVRVGNRLIASRTPAKPWVWAPFASSARTDGLLLHHWVRAGVEYTDYPYARFDVHLDPLKCTDEDYSMLSKYYPKCFPDEEDDKTSIISGSPANDAWTRGETERLLELARVYELRWPVIHDRWVCLFGLRSRSVEELQHRYYSVGSAMARMKVERAAAAEVEASGGMPSADSVASSSALPNTTKRGSSVATSGTKNSSASNRSAEERAIAHAIATGDPTAQPPIDIPTSGTSNQSVFDMDKERIRRYNLDLLWFRTKKEEREEEELRAELRRIETQLRRLKKSGGAQFLEGGASTGGRKGAQQNFPSAGSSSGSSSVVPSRASSRTSSPVPTPFPASSASYSAAPTFDPVALDNAFASAVPVPTPGTPYLQSARMVNPPAGGPGGINKTLLKRMDVVLKELNCPDNPTPTRRVCDVYDSVRKNIVTLLSLQKIAAKKESDVAVRRARLSRLTNGKANIATAAGIVAPTTTTTSASSSNRSGGTGSSHKGKSGGSSKSKSSGGSKKAAAAATTGTNADAMPELTRASTGSSGKKSTKRKKKASIASSSASATAATAAAAGVAGASGVANVPMSVPGMPMVHGVTTTSKTTGDESGHPPKTKKRARKS